MSNENTRLKGAIHVIKLFLKSPNVEVFAPAKCISEILPYVVISEGEADEARTVQLINLAIKNVRARPYVFPTTVDTDSFLYYVSVPDLVEFEALIRAQCAAEFARKAAP